MEECERICQKVKEAHRIVLVCDVPHYSPFYTKIKKITRSGVRSETVSIDQIKNVGYFHIAHFYVRGS